MPTELASFSAALIFISLIVPGYFLIEMIWREGYWCRSILQKNDNSSLDRLIHYVAVSVLVNIAFLVFVEVFGLSASFADGVAESFKAFLRITSGFSLNPNEVAILFFAIHATILIIVISSLAHAMMRMPSWYVSLFGKKKELRAKKWWQ